MADYSPENEKYASPEQLAYAGLLDIGMKVGFVVLVLTFLVYLFGFAAPHVPHEELVRLWILPVGEYLRATNTHTGWAWLSMVGKGDYMNFVGIAFLAAVTMFCYLRILPMFLAAQDKVYTVIAVLEILVLALAASGLLVVGH